MIKHIILFLLSFLAFEGYSQSALLPFKIKEDTATVRLIFKLTKDSVNNGNSIIARDYARTGLALAKKINDQKGIALCYQSLASSYNVESNHDSALYYFNRALYVCRSINYQRGIAIQYNNIGLIYYGQSKFKEAITNFLLSLKIRETIHDSSGIADIENNIGSVYWYQKAYKDALLHYSRSEAISRNIGDFERQAMSLNNLAMISEIQNDAPSALQYYNQAIDLHRKTSNDWGLATALNGLGVLYHYTSKDLVEAEKYYRESMSINQKLRNIDGLGLNLQNLGIIRADKKDFEGADKLFKEAIGLYQNNNMPQGLIGLYERMADIYYKEGLYKEAYHYHLKYSQLNDSINLGDKLAEMEAKYGKEKHENEITLLKKEKQLSELEIKRKQLIIYSAVIGALLLLVFMGFMIRAYRAKKKANSLLEERNVEITHQKHIIEEKNIEITDSINYAKRIQYALLASDVLLKNNLPEYFVFFKPKDVVSGDFYWAATVNSDQPAAGSNLLTNDKQLFCLVTADSTGHGVPGAIMSMLNISCLKESIADGCVRPHDILNSTRKKIIANLSNDGSESGGKDGMDCSAICFDLKNKKMIYAAANNPVWIVRAGELIILQADRMPVGKHDRDQVSFTEHVIDLQPGDMIYALTDGFPDQFGGPKGKKFKYKQLEELLRSNAHEPANIQKEKLGFALEQWRGSLEQVDDICIIGVRV